MSEKPKDRPKLDVPGDQDPRIFLVVDKERWPKPGLQTFFASSGEDKGKGGCGCHPVAGVYCSCNKVCTCVPAMSKTAKVAAAAAKAETATESTSTTKASTPKPQRSGCSCVGHTYSGGYHGGGCSCAPVH